MPPLPAGLCCAALLARYGYRVTVLESHYRPGGAAHSFDVQGYSFDAGPSFFAGLSGSEEGEGEGEGEDRWLAALSLHAKVVPSGQHTALCTATPLLFSTAGPPGTSTNPLKQVLDAVGESVDCATYKQARQP